MTTSLTGEEPGLSEYESPGYRISQNTDVHEARCQQYDLVVEKSGVISGVRIREPEPPHKTVDRIPQVTRRYTVRRLVEEAQGEASRMVAAAQSQDPMELATAGMSLSDVLDSLWQLRSVRSDEWASLLNFLQGALAREEFERFSVQQCQAVSQIIDLYLAGPAVRDEDVIQARETLQKNGLDPWKAISAE